MSTNGPWNLQEAITEQETSTQKAGQPLTLDIEEPSAKTPSTRSKSTKSSENATCFLRVMAGAKAVKRIDIHHLTTTKHEIRLAPPTRATLLFSDPEAQGPGSKRACYLKLCFQSLGDLKAASQAFLRYNLRCTTQFKPQSRTMSSGPLRVPTTSPMPVLRGTYPASAGPNYQQPWLDVRSATVAAARAHSYQPNYPPNYAPQYQPGYQSDYTQHPCIWEPGYAISPYEPQQPVHHSLKRHASLSTQNGPRKRQLRRESSSLDSEASFWTTAHGTMAQSQPFPEAMPYGEDEVEDEVEAEVPEQQTAAPPPKRALPPSIARHISQTPSHASAKKTTVAEAAVQTESPPVDPEKVLASGLELFQRLVTLQEQMVNECLGAACGLDLQEEQDQATLAAHYAVAFGEQFGEIVKQGL